jgi:hypothetical protein
MLALHTLILAASITVGPTVTADARHEDAIDGTWQAQQSRSAFYLNVRVARPRGFYQYGHSYQRDELDGYRRTRRNVGFELRRNAGTVRFDGNPRNARMAGTYEFTPHDGFKRSLEKLGWRGLESEQLLTMALHDITLDDVRYMQRAIEGALSAADLVRLLEYGIDPVFVRQAVEEKGRLSVASLIKLRLTKHTLQ